MALPNVAWNPADCSQHITLSNDNTTATKAATGDYAGVRGTVSYSTGLRYFEATVPSDNEGAIGLATAAAPIESPLGYSSDAGIGLYDDGTLWLEWDAFSPDQGGPFGDTRVGFLIDTSARKLWVRDSSGAWVHGGDPTSGGTGIDISLLSGALFPMMTGYYTADTSTIYSNSETITLGLPAGAALWGDDGSTNPPNPTRRPIRSVYWL